MANGELENEVVDRVPRVDEPRGQAGLERVGEDSRGVETKCEDKI